MPYQSIAQRGWMHIHHPQIAEKWDKMPGQKNLPEHKKMKHEAYEDAGKELTYGIMTSEGEKIYSSTNLNRVEKFLWKNRNLKNLSIEEEYK